MSPSLREAGHLILSGPLSPTLRDRTKCLSGSRRALWLTYIYHVGKYSALTFEPPSPRWLARLGSGLKAPRQHPPRSLAWRAQRSGAKLARTIILVKLRFAMNPENTSERPLPPSAAYPPLEGK